MSLKLEISLVKKIFPAQKGRHLQNVFLYHDEGLCWNYRHFFSSLFFHFVKKAGISHGINMHIYMVYKLADLKHFCIIAMPKICCYTFLRYKTDS